MQGWRASIEDAHAAYSDLDAYTSFFAVYDGRGAQPWIFKLMKLQIQHNLVNQSFEFQVLPRNQLENYIYGMFAFPLLEQGQMEEAEKAARKALEINKDDCWAQHNVSYNNYFCFPFIPPNYSKSLNNYTQFSVPLF
ncbi:hypothetical protein CsatB_027135 [Cannabis sativa]|uniref:uncharacterized protein LOC133030755 isoform X1 n=1 Tax=Cannabis sativa TaxID=3483 RepID=UPI0029C9BBD9|nr:uncharacterized protein LOC133030755 isoform X1 [Cannabis sativa]